MVLKPTTGKFRGSVNLPSAAERLNTSKDKIIQRWIERVRQAIPAAKNQGDIELTSSLPAFLDRLVDALSLKQIRPVSGKNINEISQGHGSQRSMLRKCSLHQVLREYQLLRESIIGVLESQGSITHLERDVILSVIEEGMAEASECFVELSIRDKRATEDSYRLVVEGIQDYAIVRIGLDAKILDWNSGAERIFQYKRDEILGKNASMLFTPEDRAQGVAEQEMKTALSVGSAEDKRWHLKKDGSRFFSNGILKPLQDESGNVLGFVKVLRVEPEKSQVELVRENFFSLPDLLLCVAGLDGYLKQLNSAWEPALGWSIEEMTSQPWLHFVHPEDQQKTKEAADKLAKGETVLRFRNRYHHKNGSYRWLEWIVRPVGNDLYGVARDTTELVEAEEAVVSSEARFRTLLETVPQFVWKINEEGEAEFFSLQFEKYTGLNPETGGLGKRYIQVVHPEDMIVTAKELEKAKVGRSPFSFLQRIKRADGQYRWHLARGNPVFDSTGELKGWIGTTTDIHEQKLLVQKLEEERELRERFVAALSHDLRNPLTSARMTAQLLQRARPHDDALIKFTDQILCGIDRADQMIQDLLDANRIRAGEKIPIKRNDCALALLIYTTIEDLVHVHGNRFEVVEEVCDIRGFWDCGGIRRILENLCNNAVKYGASDRPITLRVRAIDQKEVEISVHNEGKPLSLEEQEFLFDPFKRSKAAQESGKKGWGIGLTLVRGMVEAHGGTIQVRSGEGEGTTFTMRLPLDVRPV